MLILLDNEAFERDSDRLVNGELIAEAEAAGYDLLLTTDKNMRYLQNLTGRKIAFVVAVDAATAGSFTEVEIPYG